MAHRAPQKTEPRFPRTADSDSPVLEVRALRLSRRQKLLVQVSFAIGPGEAVQVVGPSGSGKSTLLRALARLEERDSGGLRLYGQVAERVPPPTWRRQIAYLPQQPVMLEGTVRQNLAAGYATNRAGPPPRDLDRRGAEMLRALLLEPEEVMQQDARTLSGGQAARVALARALLVDPALLLADEPTAALDRPAALALVDLIRGWMVDRGGAIVLAAHDATPWDGVDRQIVPLTGAAGGADE